MPKMDSFSGTLRPNEDHGSFEIVVPSERRAEETRLEVRYSPTLAGAMVDALPYLVEYPYGCTEQTLNRFLPAVVTQKTLLGMHLDLKAIQQKRTNLNAQEIGDDAERAKGWKRYDRNPVFDEAELTKIVKASVDRLTEMQLSDGGWGWFSGWGEQSSAHTTATVVHGLQIAKANDVALVPGVLDRGVEWLQHYQDSQLKALANVDANGNPIDKTKPYKLAADNIDALVYMVLDRRRGIHSDTDARRLPLPRPHQALRLRPNALRPRPPKATRSRQAADGPAKHPPIRRRRQRKPNRLPQAPRRHLVVSGTAASSKPTPTISSCWPRPIRKTPSRRSS